MSHSRQLLGGCPTGHERVARVYARLHWSWRFCRSARFPRVRVIISPQWITFGQIASAFGGKWLTQACYVVGPPSDAQRHITGWRVYQPMHRDALLADESTRRAWSIMHWGSRVPSVVRRQTAPWTICIYTVLLHYWLYRPLLYLVVLADPKRMSA